MVGLIAMNRVQTTTLSLTETLVTVIGAVELQYLFKGARNTSQLFFSGILEDASTIYIIPAIVLEAMSR